MNVLITRPHRTRNVLWYQDLINLLEIDLTIEYDPVDLLFLSLYYHTHVNYFKVYGFHSEWLESFFFLLHQFNSPSVDWVNKGVNWFASWWVRLLSILEKLLLGIVHIIWFLCGSLWFFLNNLLNFLFILFILRTWLHWNKYNIY